MSMHEHVSHLCKVANFQLRKISSIRPYLTVDASTQLVCSLVLSRIDYCNSLLSGLPAEELARLQMILHNAARVIFRQSKRDHVTPLLCKLHWLPVKFRIDYKIATFAYRRFDGSLPPYLSSLLHIYTPSRSLRSSSEKLLRVPKFRTKTFGQRSFQYQAPSIWNSLPQKIRNATSLSSFKSQLKTHFFKLAYCLGHE